MQSPSRAIDSLIATFAVAAIIACNMVSPTFGQPVQQSNVAESVSVNRPTVNLVEPVLSNVPESTNAFSAILEEAAEVDALRVASAVVPRPNREAPTSEAFVDGRGLACRVASEWMPAKQLRQHAQSVQELYCDQDECTRQAAAAIARFFHLQADHQQDLAAAYALRAYYAHAAIKEQTQLLSEAAVALQFQRDQQQALFEKGIATPVDLTSLDREQINQTQQRLQLEHRDRQLRQSLDDAAHMNTDWANSAIEPLEVRIQNLDTSYLTTFALANRNDLKATRYLATQIRSESAPLLAYVVNGISGLASLPVPKRCFVERVLRRDENSVMANNLRESIAIACETQASMIRREISERAIALELAYRRIELAEELIQSWEKRIAQLERLEELGDSRPADLVAADAALLAARALKIERRLEAKLAEVALSESCGGLCSRCCHGHPWLVTSPTQ